MTRHAVLDARHAEAVEAACAGDRARVAAGEGRFVRLARAHEFCLPGGPCVAWPTIVEVVAIAPGLRARRPIAATEGAA